MAFLNVSGATALALALGLVACAHAPAVRIDADGGLVFTHCAPDAAAVFLVGSFNAWQPAPMSRASGGAFQTRVAVPAGTHRYAFMVVGVDGSVAVESPKDAEGYEDDGFGAKNGVLRAVEAPAGGSNLDSPGSSVGTGSN